MDRDSFQNEQRERVRVRDGQLMERKKGRKRKGEWGRTISYNVGEIDY